MKFAITFHILQIEIMIISELSSLYNHLILVQTLTLLTLLEL